MTNNIIVAVDNVCDLLDVNLAVDVLGVGVGLVCEVSVAEHEPTPQT